MGSCFSDPINSCFLPAGSRKSLFGILNLGASKKNRQETEVEQVMEELRSCPSKTAGTCVKRGQKTGLDRGYFSDASGDHHFDEPAAALDPKHTRMVNEMVDKLTEQGITVLMATLGDYGLCICLGG